MSDQGAPLTMSSWTVVEFGKASMMTKKMDRDRTIIVIIDRRDAKKGLVVSAVFFFCRQTMMMTELRR